MRGSGGRFIHGSRSGEIDAVVRALGSRVCHVGNGSVWREREACALVSVAAEKASRFPPTVRLVKAIGDH